MDIFKKQLEAKSFGILILVLSILTVVLIITSTIILSIFALESGVVVTMLLPFLVLSISLLLISFFGIYIGIRYLKGKFFKKNEALGKILIILAISYFLYSLISFIFSNLTGNSGGELQPIIAFLWLLLIVPFGLILKNGVKDQK